MDVPSSMVELFVEVLNKMKNNYITELMPLPVAKCV